MYLWLAVDYFPRPVGQNVVVQVRNGINVAKDFVLWEASGPSFLRNVGVRHVHTTPDDRRCPGRIH